MTMPPGMNPTDWAMLRVAEWMYRGYSVADAAVKAGVQMPGPGQFAGGLQRLIASTTGADKKLAQHALRLGFQYAGHAGRRFLYHIGMLASSAASTAVIVAVLIGAIAIGVGGYIYVKSGDKPILPGPAMNRPKPEAKGGPGVTYNADDYFVFVLPQVSGGSIYVGQESQLKTMHPCDMPGGGLCGENDPPLQYDRKSPGFKSYDEATKAWCAELKGKELHYHPVASDSTASVYGGEYWIGTAPQCTTQ